MPPAEAELDGGREVVRCGHVVPRRPSGSTPRPTRYSRCRSSRRSKSTTGATRPSRHRRPRSPASAPPVDVRGRRHGLVPHDAERAHEASGHGRRLRRDRAHDRSRLEQARREVLVVAVQVEDHRMPRDDARERRQEPRRERIGVHRQGHRDRPAADRRRTHRAEVRERIVLEQGQLAGETHDRRARLGRPRRLRSHDEHPTELLLERLHALRDRRRGDAQPPRGRVERALVDDGGERAGEVERNLHLKQC